MLVGTLNILIRRDLVMIGENVLMNGSLLDLMIPVFSLKVSQFEIYLL